MSSKNVINDFVFIGLGASNSLILLTLIRKGLLKNKKVAIFEPESKTNNDKTYCFWSGQGEQIIEDLTPIISHRFNSVKVSQSSVQDIDSQPYHYIRSIDLYNHTLNILAQEQIEIYRKSVNHITCENEIYFVHNESESYQSKFIFDSRPSSILPLAHHDIYLNQSFYGLHIKCEKEVFHKDTFEMMNFNVDQNDYTQFVYIIPFSTSEALVELTRFGTNKIDVNYASCVLDKFILRDFGEYEILADEFGCIPMTTHITPSNSNKGILNTGSSANLIKPSTGYGFKNMHTFALNVAERIESNNFEKFNEINIDSKKRFKFYDKLLLIILKYWPSKGKIIFTSLFKKQSVFTVFSFLDEKSSLRQEIKIFASLPTVPFLKALYLYMKMENYTRYAYAFFIVCFYLILFDLSFQLAAYFNYGVLITGLIFVGIPHGALDHMFLKKKSNYQFLFVLKYLSIITLYYIFWQSFPSIALIVFIIYSSFHFGESELMETDGKVDSISTHFKAFLMGLSILCFIIFSHLNEVMQLVAYLVSIPDLSFSQFEITSISVGIAILSFTYILTLSIISKNRSYFSLLFLLLLGVRVPLVLAFGLYFIFQHSFNAWQHLKKGLQMTSMQLYKKSWFYTLGAILIFLFIAFNANEIKSVDGLYAKFFIFIACISLPHIFLMHTFYKTKIN